MLILLINLFLFSLIIVIFFNSNSNSYFFGKFVVLYLSFVIVMQTYIKTNFSEIHDNKQNALIGYGSITDVVYKLETHILKFSNDEFFNMDIKKGDKIEIIGVMQTKVHPIYLLVNDLKDIRKIDGHIQLSVLLKVTNFPMKRKSVEPDAEVIKFTK